jgi:hypothetical protein
LFQAKAAGKMLFDQVCKQLNLLETDYFGLEYMDAQGVTVRLDFSSWNICHLYKSYGRRRIVVQETLVTVMRGALGCGVTPFSISLMFSFGAGTGTGTATFCFSGTGTGSTIK